ncbi:arylesterase [Opitutales bacterium]|jgi:acyl-CoA thioesterase I|nr:arylesterase [Opitutales bacterium]
MTILGNRANLWFLFFFLGLLGACTENSPASIEVSDTQGQKNKPDSFRILILGDSLTEGYGVSPNQAYPHLLEQKLNQALSPNEQPYEVVNGGVTGSTTSGGASRIEWHLKSPPDFFIVALGGNDGLRGIPPAKSKQNLKSIIEQVQKKNVPVMIAGMKLPPNYGPIHLQKFAKIFPELSNELGVPLLPFLLEGVGGNPKMNLPDRIHPNPAGHKIICETVHKHLIKHLPKNLK